MWNWIDELTKVKVLNETQIYMILVRIPTTYYPKEIILIIVLTH